MIFFLTSSGEMKKAAAGDVAWPCKLSTELGATTWSELNSIAEPTTRAPRVFRVMHETLTRDVTIRKGILEILASVLLSIPCDSEDGRLQFSFVGTVTSESAAARNLEPPSV